MSEEVGEIFEISGLLEIVQDLRQRGGGRRRAAALAQSYSAILGPASYRHDRLSRRIQTLAGAGGARAAQHGLVGLAQSCGVSCLQHCRARRSCCSASVRQKSARSIRRPASRSRRLSFLGRASCRLCSLGQFLNGFPLLLTARHDAAMYALDQLRHRRRLASWKRCSLAATLQLLCRPPGIRSSRSRDVVIFLLGLVARGRLRLRRDRHALALGQRLRAERRGCASPSSPSSSRMQRVSPCSAHWCSPGIGEPRLDRRIIVTLGRRFRSWCLRSAAFEIWSRYPVDLFLYLPFLLWAGFGAGPRGVTLAAAAITRHGRHRHDACGVGSFVGRPPTSRSCCSKVFMAVITFTGLLTVAVLRAAAAGRDRPRASQPDARAARRRAHRRGRREEPPAARRSRRASTRICKTAQVLQSLDPADRLFRLSAAPASPPPMQPGAGS